MDYYGIVEFLKNMGVFEFYLPFVILFGLLFGLLEKAKIIPERRINIIIALASAFFIMAYTPAGITLTQFFSNFFTNVAVMMVTLLSLVIMVYLVIPITGKKEFPGAAKYIAFLIAIIVIGIFITSGGLNIFLPQLAQSQAVIPGLEIDPQDIIIIILIIIMILVIYFVSKGEGEKESEVRYVPVPIKT
jgi:hypothetical protein